MSYWWVNQNQTYRQETSGGYLWSPQKNSNGAYNQFYENMKLVEPGDLVFSFCDTRIPAVGIALSTGRESPKPDEFGNVGENWSDVGWRVDVDYHLLNRVIKPKDFIDDLLPVLPKKYSPIQSNGNGLQNVYLAAVPSVMAEVLIGHIGDEVANLAEVSYGNAKLEDMQNLVEDKIEEEIKSRPDLQVTEKAALTKSRRGQGLFKDRVSKVEPRCRVTGVSNSALLIASHIKPWARCSTNAERLDQNNGLMLTPTVDRLFDRGYITFTGEGEILVSGEMSSSDLALLGLSEIKNVGAFSDQQEVYLLYHRERIFRG